MPNLFLFLAALNFVGALLVSGVPQIVVACMCVAASLAWCKRKDEELAGE